MKILLIHPYYLVDRSHEENVEAVPIGMYYVGAMLKEAGHEVGIANWWDRQGQNDFFAESIKEFEPDVIGISIFNANRWGGLEIADIAKKTLPDVPVLFGGIGAGFLYEMLLTQFKCLDAVVLGEGEYVFREVVERIAVGKDWRVTEGLAYWHDSQVVTTGVAERIEDLDALPDPAKYFTFHHVASSRGCPGKCRFCGSPEFWGPKVRFHSAEYFITQIERLRKRGQRFFYVSDDTFTLKKELVLDICKGLRERCPDITWAAISRVDCVDEEMLKAMRLAGCIQISYGVETGSEMIRQILNKNTKEQDMVRAFSLTTAYGMLARAYFIYGSPGETDETIQESIDLMLKLKPLIALFHVLSIFPGTNLYEVFKKASGTTDDIWLNRMEDLLNFELDRGMTEEQVLAWGKELKEAYFENLPSFALDIELADDPDLKELQADFLSRLGMTFDYGDYADLDAPRKDEVGETLYKRALELAPNARSYLGLGMRAQKKGDIEEALEILRTGAEQFPMHEMLVVNFAKGLMDKDKHEEALERLTPLVEDGSEVAKAAADKCRRWLGL